jgi:2',3'-cyclic-nucleotide 2'-phosphodiesterase (5'-nucleotidase family)
MYFKRIFFWMPLVLLVSSCATIYQPKKVIYHDYRINNKTTPADTVVLNLVSSYGDSIHKIMNVVVAENAQTLEKKQPNGSLGLVLVDAIREMATLKYEVTVDAAFINNGGIRIPAVQKGAISVGKVFEIMPFDNLVILQKLNGKTLKEFLNLIARKGGWPVSGVSFTITNGVANNILISNKPIEDNTIYTIANSDYIANGGDDAEMLKKLPQINRNILMRDLFLDFFKSKTKKGEKVMAPTDTDRIKLL